MDAIANALAYFLGLLFGNAFALAGKFILFQFLWAVIWGLILERLIAKSGHTGHLYRWLLGLPFFSAVPLGLSLASDQHQGAEVFGSIHFAIDWLVLVYLALAPWPIRKKQ